MRMRCEFVWEERIYAYEEITRQSAFMSLFLHNFGVKVLTRCLYSCKDSKQNLLAYCCYCDARHATCALCISTICHEILTHFHYLHSSSLRAILHWCNCVVNSQVVSLWGILCRYFSTFYWLIWWINSFQVLIDDIENWFMRFVYSMLHHCHYLYFVIVFQSIQTN